MVTRTKPAELATDDLAMHGAVVNLRRKIVMLSVAVVLLGASQCVLWGERLSRFSGLEYLPRMMGLVFIGELSVGIAMWCALLFGVYAIDFGARSTHPNPSLSFKRHAAFAGAIAVLGPAPACVLLFAGAMGAWRVWFGQDARAFVAGVRAAVQPRDVLSAAPLCAIDALLVIAVLIAGRRVWTSMKHSIRAKLTIAAGVLVGLNVAARFL